MPQSLRRRCNAQRGLLQGVPCFLGFTLKPEEPKKIRRPTCLGTAREEAGSPPSDRIRFPASVSAKPVKATPSQSRRWGTHGEKSPETSRLLRAPPLPALGPTEERPGNRVFEFGYSHANKEGRMFLGEDDKDFNPWMTFPDPKYIEKWREHGWLRSDRARSRRPPPADCS